MRYFVTGATGFVGGRVVRQLLAAGHQVRALVRARAKAKDLADLGVELFEGDVTDKQSLRAPMAGTDGVFHIAGWYKLGVRDKRPGVAINVWGTRNVLELMRDLGLPKGVYTSTLAVNSDTRGALVDEHYTFTGRHLSEYDKTKAEAHAVAEAFMRAGLPLVIVQPGLVYGPGDTSSLRPALIQVMQGRQPFMPTSTGFCWSHVDDIAAAHLAAMDRGRAGESYLIGGPPHTVVEAFSLVAELAGVRPPPLRMPPAMLKATAAVMRLIEPFAAVPENFTAEYLRVNAGTTYYGDNAKARRELGYNPRSLREGMEETVRHELALLGKRDRVKG